MGASYGFCGANALGTMFGLGASNCFGGSYFGGMFCLGASFSAEKRRILHIHTYFTDIIKYLKCKRNIFIICCTTDLPLCYDRSRRTSQIYSYKSEL